jgi:hypothetical protein
MSLIEVIIASVILTVGILAVLISSQASTSLNQEGTIMTRATFLGQEIREWTLNLPFDDPNEADYGNPPGPDGTSPQTFVDDLDDLLGMDGTGVVYSPPRDSQGVAMPDMTGWSEKIVLTWRSPSNPATVVANGASDLVHVEVIISYLNEEVYRMSWLVTERHPD